MAILLNSSRSGGVPTATEDKAQARVLNRRANALPRLIQARIAPSSSDFTMIDDRSGERPGTLSGHIMDP